MREEVLTMEEKVCPYLNITCQPTCPAWLTDLDDCLFHVCLTQVEEVFYQAAAYLDEKLDLSEGTGYNMLANLRKVMSGNATEEDKKVVRAEINRLLTFGVLVKIEELTITDLASIFSTVEKVIHFDLASLFSRPAEDEEDEEDEGEPLIFRE